MRAAVVYESMYGNTHAIAEAIAEGLRDYGDVELLCVAEADSARVGEAEVHRDRHRGDSQLHGAIHRRGQPCRNDPHDHEARRPRRR